MQPQRYHPALRILHWSIAILIIAALLLGTFVMAPTPNADPGKSFLLLKHIAAGLLVFGLTVTRMIVRPRTQKPPPVSSGIAIADFIVPYVHRLFDLLVFAMVGSGIGIAITTGLLRALALRAPLPASFDVLPHTLHVFFARTLMAFLALHVCGAIYHHFILRDGLLWRMLHPRLLVQQRP